MKTLAKFFFAVAALFAFACTTDTTEEFGIGLDGKVTEFAVSLEESRTQLGEKVGEFYPLFWSEGDKISVNGVESAALTANQAGSAVTSFTLSGTLNAPYCVTYPAAPAGQVLFAEKQSYTSNTTFASGVTTMYAYSDNLSAQMAHLTGVLKIGVTGSAKLVLAQISTIDRKPIAGAFDFDFTTGEATATETSKEVIEYSFGEGVTLSEEPTYIHVAVPAGIYTELYVTLYDAEGGVMYATVKTDSEKPLVAGNVRTFVNAIPYAATHKAFVVKDVASLKAFAEQAATLDKEVIFVSDVDLAGETWTPIEGYAGIVRGNGYAIKGLTAPLFGSTSATIRGLHLTNVNIVETANPNVGAFARNILASELSSPVVEHCSASGKITINCQDFTPEVDSHISIAAGGLVGYVKGASFYDCVNNVALDVKQSAKSGNTNANAACFGGISGFTYTQKYITPQDTVIVLSNCVNCKNNANIKIVEKSFTGTPSVEGMGKFSPVAVWVGGIIGSNYSTAGQPNTGSITSNLVNNGTIEVSDTYSADCFISGIIANTYTSTRDKWVNNGKISLSNCYASRVFVAGITGCIQSATLANSHNYGAIEVKDVTTRNANIGGVVALSKGSISSCENSGALNINCDIPYRSAVYGDYKEYAIGGVVGITTGSTNTIVGCTNNAKGSITISGEIYNQNPDSGYHGIGGVAGVLKSLVENSQNDAPIYVELNTYYFDDGTTNNAANAGLYIGGAAGSVLLTNYNKQTLSNNGDVTVAGGTYSGPLYVAGLIGFTTQRVGGASGNPATNTGSITICESGKTLESKSTTRVAGCTAYSGHYVVDLTNKGTININDGATFNGPQCLIGGIVAAPAQTKDRNITRNDNQGNINIAGIHNGRLVAGGIAAEVRTPFVLDSTNSGTITLKSTLQATSATSGCVGGICGLLAASSTGGARRLVNSGDIVVEKGATFTAETRFGGIIGLADSGDIYDHKSTGDITVSGSFSNRLCVGGALGYCNTCTVASANIGCHNEGKITITSDATSTQLTLGGVVGVTKGAIRNSSNQGDIEIASAHTAMVRIGGIIGWVNAGGVNTVANSGNITITSTAKFPATPVQIGGGIGINEKTATKLVNTGTITIEDGVELPSDAMIAGCIADARDNCTVSTNTGDILFYHDVPKDNAYFVGGVLGKMPANKTIKDLQCFGRLSKCGSANFGFISATPRDATHYIVGGGIGGVIINGWDDSDGEPEPDTAKVMATNYWNHIYGGTTDWTGVENYDGCEFLNAAPEVTVPWPNPGE